MKNKQDQARDMYGKAQTQKTTNYNDKEQKNYQTKNIMRENNRHKIHSGYNNEKTNKGRNKRCVLISSSH